MSKAERERRHQANLRRIEQVQQVVGKGDRARVDHEGTLLERARLLSQELESHQATEQGLAALDRLLRRAEEGAGRHRRDIVDFLEAVCGHRPLALATLRGLEGAVGDDMLAVLDAFRYGRLTLAQHVPGGPSRVQRLLEGRRLASA